MKKYSNILLNKLINFNYEIKYLILFTQDLFIYILSSIFAILFFTFQKGFLIESIIIYLITSLFFLICSSIYFNIYKSFLRYGEFRNLLKTFSYVFISFCLTSFSIYFLINEIYLTFQKISFLSHLLIFTLIVSSRIFIFFIIKNYQKRKIAKKIIVYGAGYAGAQISQNQNYEIVAFIDEDLDKVGRTLNDIKIYDSKSTQHLIKKYNPDFLLIAIPSLTQNQRKFFINKFIEFNIPIKILPSVFDIFTGKNKLNEINNFELSDFIERDISWDQAKITDFIKDKIILITGAGGSIGSELTKQVILSKPKIVILVDHSEYNLFKINTEIESLIKKKKIKSEYVSKLGSIKDIDFLNIIFKYYTPQIIFHTAAYKHVNILENNFIEAVKTNILGTKYLLDLSYENNVEHFHYISTDKAVNPKSVMGATKRFSEKLVNSYNRDKIKKTVIVRFGNVINSDGSVLPIFKDQIEKGGPITLTDTRVTRYFMSIKEAVGLVLESGHLSNGGEFFVLNMGEPIKILDIIKKMIKIYGLTEKINGNGDIEIKIIGLRKGEKLHEEVYYGLNKATSKNKDIFKDDDLQKVKYNDFSDELKSIEIAIQQNNINKIKSTFEKYTNYVN